MKAKIFAVFLFLMVSFLAVVLYVSAQDITSIMSQNKIRTCLNADPTITKTKNRACRSKDPEEEAECEAKGEWLLGDATQMHLTGSCDAPAGCEIWHENSAREVSNIQAGFRKVVNHVAAGPVNVTVTGTFRDHGSHTFYAIGDAPVVTETGEGGVEAENQTQQVGQVSNFEFPQTQGSAQECVGVYWDPFGRVFDAVSLEPIPGVNVSLFQSPSKQLVFLPTNPALTDKAGIYNILVDTEDDYYINVISPATHSFIADPDLNPNYSLIYSDLYSPGEVFHEPPLPANIPEDFDISPYHHDIPLQPKGEPYREAVAEVVEGTLSQIDLNDFVNYKGQVTYPLAQICLVGETSGVVNCGNADKYGNFNISIDKLSLPQEFIEVKVEKVDLTAL